ncbi:MAG: hypothetical protein JSW53_03475, partial [Candidatus Bathyarchaeota archaeon]
EEKLEGFLRDMKDEIILWNEYVIEEAESTRGLCLFLRTILTHLDASLSIPPKSVPLFEKARQIVLNGQGHLILLYEDGRVDSKVMSDCRPDTVLAVVWSVIPSLRKMIRLRRQKIEVRVDILRKIRGELENASGAFEAAEGSIIEPVETSHQGAVARKISIPEGER